LTNTKVFILFVARSPLVLKVMAQRVTILSTSRQTLTPPPEEETRTAPQPLEAQSVRPQLLPLEVLKLRHLPLLLVDLVQRLVGLFLVGQQLVDLLGQPLRRADLALVQQLVDLVLVGLGQPLAGLVGQRLVALVGLDLDRATRLTVVAYVRPPPTAEVMGCQDTIIVPDSPTLLKSKFLVVTTS